MSRTLTFLILLFVCFYGNSVWAQGAVIATDPNDIMESYTRLNEDASHLERLTTLNHVVATAFESPSNYQNLMIQLTEDLESNPTAAIDILISLQFHWERLPQQSQGLFTPPENLLVVLPPDQTELYRRAFLEKTLVDFSSVAVGIGAGTGLYVYAKRTTRVASQVNRALTPAKITPLGFFVGILISVVVEIAADQAIDHFYERSLLNKIEDNFHKIEKLNRRWIQRRRFLDRAEYTKAIVESSIKLAVFYDKELIEEFEEILIALDEDELSDDEAYLLLLDNYPNFFAADVDIYTNPSMQLLLDNLETLRWQNAEFPELQAHLEPIESYLFLMESLVNLSQWGYEESQ